MKKHRKSSLGKSRDFGIPGANGKGSKSRVTDQSAYAQNFDEIDWGRGKDKTVVHAYDSRTGTFVPYPETDGEWPDVMGIGPSTPVTNDLIRE